ncbi:alpha-glucosidase C-terminal domain-containing protein [Alteromonas oceanisediminis]|uniref:alpha-glucosidase C-terminal domain-containing protein n=1 Tax=Alteromonas oceanisediminis TaxID=2836180 RepID=UPI001BDA504F|nr:alpha-glucosidase C-terminal domain-containing protein [Alteromonas oceanisediminis]MBT0586072.1 alpha-glucosidase C-terminal domain-containing protein [Alteromonas oceanisediminis]
MSLDPILPQVYAYSRSLADEKVIVLLNFSANKASLALSEAVDEVVINNLDSLQRDKNNVTLAPYQAVILR